MYLANHALPSCPCGQGTVALSGNRPLFAAQAVEELRALFALAEAYGIADFLQFDASCIRGLSYYTGVLFSTPCLT